MAWQDALQRVWWQQSQGMRRMLLPLLLTPPALGYRMARALAGLPWRLGWRVAQTLRAPVVVVGNLVVGGAGKTPVVLALVQALRDAGFRPGVVSRGYQPGRRAIDPPRPVHAQTLADECGDEPLLLQRRAQAPVWVGRRRAEAARALLAAHPEVDIVISDDGLQHLALPRTVQVLVFDTRGAGNGRLLPAGPLREPLPQRLGPRDVVVYNAPSPSTPLPGHCTMSRLGAIQPLADWWRGRPAPVPAAALEALRGRLVIAAAGIAHPERFFAMLEAAGLQLRRLPLRDHAEFSPRPWPDGDEPVIVTEKDAVKLRPDAPDAARIHVATLDFTLALPAVAAVLAALPPPATCAHGSPSDRTPGLPDLQGSAGTRA
jgi:tetraacyldisaccharide 4'-kinase